MNKLIDTFWLSDPAPLHVAYRDNFNLVDLVDRYWYFVADYHHNTQWEFRLLFGILQLKMINCWALWILNQYEEWKDFRENVAKELIHF